MLAYPLTTPLLFVCVCLEIICAGQHPNLLRLLSKESTVSIQNGRGS